MKYDFLLIKPIIRNIVATADLQQTVEITKFVDYQWATFDSKKYGGRCGYIKPQEMSGKVTVFASGKMISLGAKNINDCYKQLQIAKFYLLKNQFISDKKIIPKVQNIVATLDLKHPLNILKLHAKLNNSIYEPDQFPGVILKNINGTFLIFASGKIVITGIKSEDDVKKTAFELIQQLELSYN